MGYVQKSVILTEQELRDVRRVVYLLDIIWQSKKEVAELKEKLRLILAKNDTDWLYVTGLLEFCRYDDGTIQLRRHR